MSITIPTHPALVTLVLCIALPIALIAWGDRNTVGDYGFPLGEFLLSTLSFGAGLMYGILALVRWISG